MEAHSQPSFLSLLNPLYACRTLYRHRALLWQFTWRNVEMRHRGSLLGILWSVLNPLLMLALYVFVFSYIFGGTFGVVEKESRWDYGLGVFLGLSIFHLISESIAIAPTIITGNPNFVKKVVFPLEVLPASAVGAAVFHMTITVAMIIVGLLLGGRGLSLSALWLPVIMIPIVALALGMAWFLAALGVFFRDIGQIVGAAVTALMFASAIFYPASRVAEKAPFAWPFIRWNPLIHAIEAARDVLLWDRPFSTYKLGMLYLAGGLAAFVGFACFARCKRAFADVM
jgi:lipopolysaccharide transport system permease protein